MSYMGTIRSNFFQISKMDAFDDAFGGEGGAGGVPPAEVEVDPAAEFLAKEQVPSYLSCLYSCPLERRNHS